MMPTIRVIRVDYADESRYHTDFNTEDFIKFILSHRNYDFHIRALDAEAAFGCLDMEILMSAFNYI